MSQELIQEGIAALKAGRRLQARSLLARAVQMDPDLEEGWLWLSGAVDGDDQRRACLEKVLALNPDNLAAQQGLQKLQPPPAGEQAAAVPPADLSVPSMGAPKPPAERSAPDMEALKRPAVEPARACPKCSTANSPWASYCNQCGTPLPAPEPRSVPAAQTGQSCPQCASANRPWATFCSQCGTPLPASEPRPEPPSTPGQDCPECGSTNSPWAAFCNQCGASLRRPYPPHPRAAGLGPLARPEDWAHVGAPEVAGQVELQEAPAPRSRPLGTALTWLGFLSLLSFLFLIFAPTGGQAPPLSPVLLVTALISSIVGWRLRAGGGLVKILAGLTLTVSALYLLLIGVVIAGTSFFPEYFETIRTYLMPIAF